MQHERDPLNLGSLPLVSPPGDDWPELEAILLKQNRRRQLLRTAGGTLAAAATLILAVAVFVYRPFDMPAGVPGTEQAQAVDMESPVSSDKPLVDTVGSLIALSQQLESNLQRYRSQIGVLPTSSVIYQIELEDLVAQVDDELSARPDSVDLWSQRVNLMLDLSQLYQNELRREYHRMASL